MSDYSQLKVTDLKDVLKQRGIPSTGLTRKQQIIDALLADDAKSGDVDDGGQEAEEVNGESTVAAAAGEGEVEAVEAQAAASKLDSDRVEKADNATEDKETNGDGAGQTQEAITNSTAPATTDEPSKEESVADTSTPEPIVLEAHQPVSKDPSQLATPQQTSPPETTPETRKRKRRSPTPSLPPDAVHKKLRSIEEDEDKLSQGAVVEDAPVPMDDVVATMKNEGEAKITPYGSSDDVMDVSQQPKSEDDLQTSSVFMALAPTDEPLKRPHDHDEDVEESISSPAIHPATRAIYIRNLVRPLQPAQLQSHLEAIAAPPTGAAAKGDLVQLFHLDVLRSHAFASFPTVSHASRVRANLHDMVWPDEPARKPLWVDFIPEEKLQDWIDTEMSSGTSRRDAKRWEVLYDTDQDTNEVTATLQEVQQSTAGQHQPSFSSPSVPAVTQGQGMPNAPSGPRSQQQQQQQQPPASQHQSYPERSQPRSQPPIDRPLASPQASASFSNLDQHFKSTLTKPKLYFLPQPAALVDKRLDELDALTSRDWSINVPPGGAGGPAEGQLRRYTFEDGDRLVDGGPDKGDFGLVRVPRRGGGRGGGGGRWRGR